MKKNLSYLFGGLGLSMAFLSGSSSASAQTITPESFTGTLELGEKLVINKTITLPETGIDNVDFFALTDKTGSMSGVINSVRISATNLFTELDSTYSNAGFGVGSYIGDVSEGIISNLAYQLDLAIDDSANKIANAQSAINTWFAFGGGDANEANLFALHQAITEGDPTISGVSSGHVTGWRSGSLPVILWWGDVPGHTETVTLDETIAALDAENAVVIALNSGSAGFGIDASENFFDFGGDDRNQASTILSTVDGELFNNFTSVPTGNVVDTIVDIVGMVTTEIDLNFFDTFAGTGLAISYACTDPLGCEDVPAGETREFQVMIEALETGDYEFEVGVLGVDALEFDKITVVGSPPPPPAEKTPEPTLLLGLGLTSSLALLSKKKSCA